jgi:hypothetical protein
MDLRPSALACIACKKPLPNFAGEDSNHPMNGLEFVTYGHYGSTVFDPMDGSSLVINICDECVVALGRAGLVGAAAPKQTPIIARPITPWQATGED